MKENRITLRLAPCPVCTRKIAWFNGYSIHCRVFNTPERLLYMSNLESKILAELMYPPGVWRGESEMISYLYPNSDNEPDWAVQCYKITTNKIRKKLTGTGVMVVNGVLRGKTLYLP